MLSWTIIDAAGEVLYPSVLTEDEQHPVDAGWDLQPGQECIPSDVVPVPGIHSWTGEEWVVDLAAAKERKRKEVNAIKAAMEDGGVDTPWGRADSDLDSRGKITGLVVGALVKNAMGQPFAEDFTMKDNSVVPIPDATAMMQFGLRVLGGISVVHNHATALKKAIDAATSISEVEAIDVQAGWPEL